MHIWFIILCLVLAIPMTIIINKVGHKMANTPIVLYIYMSIYIAYLFYLDSNMTKSFKKACYKNIRAELMIGFSASAITSENWKSIALIVYQNAVDEVIIGINKKVIQYICESAGIKPENIHMMNMHDFINKANNIKKHDK